MQADGKFIRRGSLAYEPIRLSFMESLTEMQNA